MAAPGDVPGHRPHREMASVSDPQRYLEYEEADEVQVPVNMVGLIIGKGGEQIKNLRRVSGANIQIAENSKCTISGTRDAINHAKKLIFKLISFGNLSTIEIGIPESKVGCLIGKGGKNIKQLKIKCGVKMKIIRNGTNQVDEETLRISGETNKVEIAKQLVYDMIAANKYEVSRFEKYNSGQDAFGDIGHKESEKREHNRERDKYGQDKHGQDNKCYRHTSTLQKEVTIYQAKCIMKNCCGILVPEERNGLRSTILYIIKSDCQIEIGMTNYPTYYENGQLKPVNSLQKRLSVKFDMIYNSNKRCLEAIYIWVGEKPSKKKLQGSTKLRYYNGQINEENIKRKRIQKQEREQYIYRMQMSRLSIILKRYLNKIPVNYDLMIFNSKISRKKSWYKKKIMRKKIKFKNFILGRKQKHVKSCKKTKKWKIRGIKPTIVSTNPIKHISRSSFSLPNKRTKVKTNELNKYISKCSCQYNIGEINKSASTEKNKRRRIKKKIMQCLAGSACRYATFDKVNSSITFDKVNSSITFDKVNSSITPKPSAESSLQFWSNKRNMKWDKNLQNACFQKVDKRFFEITENVRIMKKNSSEIKQLIWTETYKNAELKEDFVTTMLPVCMQNLRRIIVENDISFKHLQIPKTPSYKYQKRQFRTLKTLEKTKIPSPASYFPTLKAVKISNTPPSVSHFTASKFIENINLNANVPFNTIPSVIQEPSKVSEPCQTENDMKEHIKSFRFPVPLKPIPKKKSNKSGKKSSR